MFLGTSVDLILKIGLAIEMENSYRKEESG